MRGSSSAIASLDQSSFVSEKALFGMVIQLRRTVEEQPMRPTKNMASRRSFAQIINLRVISMPARSGRDACQQSRC